MTWTAYLPANPTPQAARLATVMGRSFPKATVSARICPTGEAWSIPEANVSALAGAGFGIASQDA